MPGRVYNLDAALKGQLLAVAQNAVDLAGRGRRKDPLELLPLRFGQGFHHLGQALAIHLNQGFVALDVGFILFVSQDLDLPPAGAEDLRQPSYVVDVLVGQNDAINTLEVNASVFDSPSYGIQLSRDSGIDERGPIRVPQQSGIYDAALTRQVHMQLEGFDVFSDPHRHTRLFAPNTSLLLISAG